MKPCHCKTIPMRSQPTLRRFTILSTAFLHDQSLIGANLDRDGVEELLRRDRK